MQTEKYCAVRITCSCGKPALVGFDLHQLVPATSEGLGKCDACSNKFFLHIQEVQK
jgi:hypothetical protein